MTHVEPQLSTRILAARRRPNTAIHGLDYDTALKEWRLLDRLLDQWPTRREV